MFDVVGLGLNATDVAIEVPHYPEFNSKVEFRSAGWQAGGQVATALVVCQRLGLKTKYIGRVGDEVFGRFQLESLRREGLEIGDVKVVAECPNQVAYIIIDAATGERTILWRRDPRLSIQPEEITAEMVTCGRLLHVDGHDTAAAARAASLARQAGIQVTADVDNIYPGLEGLLANVDYLVSSAQFPGAWTGEQELPRALERLRAEYGMKLAAATLGRDGVVALTAAGFLYQAAYAVACRDTTGAGDVFHGAFIYGLLADWPVSRILEFSCAMAGLNSTALGARGGIASLAEAERLMATGARHPARWRNFPAASRSGAGR
ncbi:MAG: carbohydrate kinase family protein [Terriglobia bacterium]